jgi:hypothetical protein
MLACRGTKWRHIESEYPASKNATSITLLPEHLLHFERTGTLAVGLSITVVSFCWRICLISESMGHHDSEIMDDGSID